VLSTRVGALLKQRETPVEIVGIATENTPLARAKIPSEIPFLSSSDELFLLKPDLVIEAAGRSAITRWAPAALAVAPAMIIASTSAFSDDGRAWLAKRFGRA
jgi:aspartate dehydrogenase